MQHVILTRYNCDLYSREDIDHEAWMEHRIRYFKKYCVPSITQQTCQNFLWQIHVDRRTPSYRLDEITDACSDKNITWCLNIHSPKFKPGFDVLTTRFDNDDALNPQFVEHVQAKALEVGPECIIDAPVVCRVNSEGYWALKSWTQGSPLVSIRSKHHTAFTTTHHKIKDTGLRYTRLPEQPYLLQICHEYNLVNEIETKGPILPLPVAFSWITL